jgi:class 3 adenylate cyclase
VFGAPLPCEDSTARAVRLAVTMRAAIDDLQTGWRKRGHALGFSVGVDHGYATVGVVGAEPRMDYTAVGRVPNLAVRLCGEAGDREILVSQRVFTAVESLVEAEPEREYTTRGTRPVIARNVRALAG